MRTPKQAKHVLERLVKDAVLEGILYPFGSAISRERPKRKGIGYTINRLSEEDKELLNTLKSEDTKDIRWGK